MKSGSSETFPASSLPTLTAGGEDALLYVQIYDIFYDLIHCGMIHPGDIIPSEHDLAVHFDVSRGTVRQALRYLEEDGLVIKRQGRGSEVADPERHNNGGLQGYSDVCREFCTVSIDEIRVEWTYTGIGHWMSQQLELPKGAIIVVGDITYCSAGEACALSQRLIPVSLLERYSVDATNPAAMREFLLDTIPQTIARSRSEILIKTEAIPGIDRSDKIPCLSVSEIAYDALDRPVAHLKNYLRNDCYRVHLFRRQRSH